MFAHIIHKSLGGKAYGEDVNWKNTEWIWNTRHDIIYLKNWKMSVTYPFEIGNIYLSSDGSCLLLVQTASVIVSTVLLSIWPIMKHFFPVCAKHCSQWNLKWSKKTVKQYDHYRVYWKFPKKEQNVARVKCNKKPNKWHPKQLYKYRILSDGAYFIFLFGVWCSVFGVFWRFTECVLCAHDVT